MQALIRTKKKNVKSSGLLFCYLDSCGERLLLLFFFFYGVSMQQQQFSRGKQKVCMCVRLPAWSCAKLFTAPSFFVWVPFSSKSVVFVVTPLDYPPSLFPFFLNNYWFGFSNIPHPDATSPAFVFFFLVLLLL